MTTLTYPTIASPKVEYPDSDGDLMAESDFQRKPLTYTIEALNAYYQNRSDVYVSGNILFYYEKGNPQAVVSPDVLVVIGAEKRDRSSYLLWQESKTPDFVLEITSQSTMSRDQGPKRGLYAYLGIQEYFQYDPTSDYLEPPLQGLWLVSKNYLPIPAIQSPDGILAIHSRVLQLDLRLEPNGLRFYNPLTGEKLLTYQELEEARRSETTMRQALETKVKESDTTRQPLEVRLAELEVRLKALENKD